MSKTLTNCVHDSASEKLSDKPLKSYCVEICCTAETNLCNHDDDVSISDVNVSCTSGVLAENDVSFDSNVFNHISSMSRDVCDPHIDSSLNSECDESTRCHFFTDDDVQQVSAFSDLHKFRSNYSKQIVFGHLNINSLRNKFFEIYEILSNELIDVFGLTETKLDSSFTSTQFNVPDYTMHRADRNSHGGGILFYVKSVIPPQA